MPVKSGSFRRILLALIVVALAIYLALFVDWKTYKQGEWSQDIKDAFYFTDQGSKLLPVDWFMGLPGPDANSKFTDKLDRFGFIPAVHDTPLNKYKLPIGFAVHVDSANAQQE